MLLDEDGAMLVCTESAVIYHNIVETKLTTVTEPAVAVLACDVVNAAGAEWQARKPEV